MPKANGALHTHSWQSLTQALTGLGLTFAGARNLYHALGWKPTLTAQDYINKYLRQDIANRAIEIYPEYTWRTAPRITDDAGADPVTPFEAAYQALAQAVRLPHMWHTLDRLMGLGQYAILLLGAQDGQDLSQPLRSADTLLYVSPYGEGQATVRTWNGDPASPRFLKPEVYDVQLGRGRTGLVAPGLQATSLTQAVHWTRVIHVAENSFDGGVMGLPRLQCLYNRLDDLEKLLGGSAEMFWQAGRGNLVFALRDGAQPPTGDDATVLQEQMDEFTHGLRQALRVQGIDVERLQAAVASPKDALEMQLTLIAAALGAPQRILYGSERGELASTQDQAAWETTITSRRTSVAEPLFVRATVQRLIDVGILPVPREGPEAFDVIWPPGGYTDPLRQAEIAERVARAAAIYQSSGVETLILPEEFRGIYLGLAAVPEGGFPDEEPDEEPDDDQGDDPTADDPEEDATA